MMSQQRPFYYSSENYISTLSRARFKKALGSQLGQKHREREDKAY
jgi:hypothetical protein